MIPFSPPRVDQRIIDEVVDTLKSGWWTTGPKTKRFEKEITAYCGNQSTVCLNSATAGLELVLRWFGVGEGDEVILPAYTYCATANVVEHCGAKPVLVDVGSDFNISVSAIEKAITPRTKVIMPVDLSGFPCDYKKINELVRSEKVKALFQAKTPEQKQLGRILVLSDAAHSFGASVNGVKAGALTDISVFSFHAVKNLTTSEGGAIAFNLPDGFNHEEIYKYFCMISLHGQSKDALAKMQKGAWKYDVVEAGFKCNMTDILASIGLVELARYDSETLKKRKYIFEKYTEAFKKYDWAEFPSYETTEKISSYHIYLLRIKGIDEAKRDAIIQEIFNHDVSVNVHFQPLPLLSYYKNKGYDIKHYPVAYDNFSREITLPVFFDLSDDQIQQVIDATVASVNKFI